jgi:hypothetical protein
LSHPCDILIYEGGVIMPRFKFKISELEYRTLDAFDLDDALDRAGIRSDFLAKYIFSL